MLAFSMSAKAYNCHDYKFYVGLALERTFVDGQVSNPRDMAIGKLVLYPNISVQKSQYKPYVDGKSVVVGFNLRRIGVELGYTAYDKIKYPILYVGTAVVQYITAASPVTGQQTGNNAYADAIFYYQFWKNFVAKLHTGMGFLTTKYQIIATFNTAGTTPASQVKTTYWGHGWGFRIGAGLQWNFARHWSTELFWMRQSGNDLLQNLNSARIGLNYYI